MLQAVVHDVKNKLAELALRLVESDPGAAALALEAADKLTQALWLDRPGELAPVVDSACPGDMVEEMVAEYGPLFPGKNLRIDISEAPVLWYYDAGLVRLALSNVVHNALKHCSNEVELRAYEDAGYLVFEVRDDGNGFPAILLESDSDQQMMATRGSRRGTGLGLLLGRRIVGAHVVGHADARRAGWLRLNNQPGALLRLGLP
jgi:K+-sensing histidine kinase KdpD